MRHLYEAARAGSALDLQVCGISAEPVDEDLAGILAPLKRLLFLVLLRLPQRGVFALRCYKVTMISYLHNLAFFQDEDLV